MKTRLFASLLILLAVGGMSSCKNHVPPQDQVYLYSFEKTPPVTAERSKQLISDYLGEKAADLTLNKDENVVYYVSADSVNATFEQNLTNGSFEFTKLPKDYGNVVPKLPSSEEARRIAEGFLQSRNVAPRNASELKLVHTGGVREQAVVGGQRAGPVIDKLITLTYGRELDGLQVIGAGSKIVINIGDKGEVVGMIHRWRELDRGSAKAVQAGEAFTQAEAEEQARKQIQEEFGQVPYEIRSAVKSYYDANGSYLQPVWAFNVQLNLSQTDKNVPPVKYLCVIPMLKNSPESLQLTARDPRAKELIKTGRAGGTPKGQTDGD